MNQVQNIFGILLSIFILSYILQNWLDIKVVQNAKHYYKEALYATGIKKRPIIEPSIGGIFKMVAQIPKMFMMVFKIMSSVGGIASFIANLAQGTINIIAGMILSLVLSTYSIFMAFFESGILAIYVIEFIITRRGKSVLSNVLVY